MKDIIILFIVVTILAAVVFYIYKAKKRGKKCIGCPCAGNCAKSACGCQGNSCSTKK